MDESCNHLDTVVDVTPSDDGCHECLQSGDSWVHLRICQACGHVGCCDSSPNRHATRHYRETQHPLIRSFEPGEHWWWCYPEELLFVVDWGTGRAVTHVGADRRAAVKQKGIRVMELKLEVVIVPVTDVDKAKHFYGTGLACREDIDVSGDGGYRCVQMTPPGSQCSIIFGTGVTSAAPGSLDRLVLAVDDIEKARAELAERGVDVSEIFRDADGGLGGGFRAGTEGRAAGPDPQRRSYASYASFSDPDGNRWLLQEIRERLPGRV